jgi:hypothetical protein
VKDNRFFRILAAAAIFSLLMLTIPATSVLAVAEEIKVTPEKAEIGDYVDIKGSNFTPGTVAYIYFSSQKAEVGDEISVDVTCYKKVKTANVQGQKDTNPPPGTFEYIGISSIEIPTGLYEGTVDEDVHGGDYYIYATYESGERIEAVAELTVIGIKELTPTEGPVGTEVKIDGVGYDKYEDITAYYDGEEVTIGDSGPDETDSGGAFRNVTIIVPESTAGAHTITVVGVESTYEGEATFTVEPEMTLSATAGAIASQITASGTGFGKNKDITITFGDDEVAIIDGDDNTNACGSFEAIFTVPELEPDIYDVVVEDDDGNEVSAEFAITTDLLVNPLYTAISPGYVGAQVEISGVGFKPNSTITITYTSEPVVFTTESQADGSFSYILTIPPSEAGAHTITATDGIIPTPQQVTFYMESTPPPIPQPKQPMDEKLGGQFEWYAVTDLSLPLTYDLQIATDANFIDIVVERTGLAVTEYTLTEEEELESTGEDEPYYWRVRAVDAASNVGSWSSPSSFTIGFSFSGLPGWLLWTLIGIGAVVLFFLGFWLGRRTGYDYY